VNRHGALACTFISGTAAAPIERYGTHPFRRRDFAVAKK
jgi:hypothetical protein